MRGQIRHNGGWRSWRNAAVACLSAAFLLFSGNVQAASLEKIEVASSIGQPLYAEVPLLLEGNELASKVFIEIASAADYKIFEVYRDPILNSIRADVASDERGARVKLTSRTGIKTPFFNLVLKVRYGRVSHFKKYSVFLDSAKSIERIAAKEPLPQVEIAKAVVLETGDQATAPSVRSKLTESSGNALITKQIEEHVQLQTTQQAEAEQNSPEKTDSWARIDKYGPIVRGDSLSIVANRLRTDARYSSNQVMVALFEKNRGSFEKENMNLIKAGSYLLAPTEQEIEKLSRSEAFRVVASHESTWKEQPRYPIEAEVQRSRYSNRVRFGEQADGESSALAEKPAGATQDLLKAEENLTPVVTPSNVTPVVVETAALTPAEDLIAPQIEKLMQVQSETNQLLLALQEKNEELQQQLLSNKESVDGLREKVDEGEAAAANARVEKLEILLTRLQAQLDKQAAQAPTNAQATSGSEWITWLLLTLVVVMLGVIAIRMRKEPLHPASDQLLSEIEAEPAVAEVSKAESLEEVVEEAVDSIETDEAGGSTAKAGSLDSMASFSDELSDTDTAELEAFDVDAKQEVDPNVDYLSEADVYIRYGMDDEALQQLDMALRVNPVNTDAHVKKSELLHDKQDKAGFAAAVAAATAVLAAVELKKYQSAVESFGGDVEMPASSVTTSEPVEPLIESTEIESGIAIDDTEIDELNFDLTGVEVAGHEKHQAAVSDVNEEPADELNWLSDPSFGDNEAEQDDSALSMDLQNDSDLITEEPAGLSFETDDALKSSIGDAGVFGGFSEESSSAMELEGDELPFEKMSVADELDSINAEDTTDLTDSFDAGATQELGSLLSEFSEEEDAVEEFGNLLSEFNDPATFESQSYAAVSEEDAIEEFGNLLSEFNEPVSTGIETPVSDTASVDAIETLEFGGTQELGNLLSEFTETDDSKDDLLVMGAESDASEEFGDLLSEFSGEPELEAATVPDATEEFGNLLSEFSGQAEVESSAIAKGSDASENLSGLDTTDVSTEMTEPFEPGATQHLDALLGEFSDNDDGFDVTMIDEAKADPVSNMESLGIDMEHGATQELDSLLAEFSDDEGGLGFDFIDSVEIPTADVSNQVSGNNLDHGATQELDSLLSEFADADENETKQSDSEHGATQVLGNLLDEFNFDDDEDDKKS